MIEIRRAGCGEEHTILEFYDQLIDHMQDTLPWNLPGKRLYESFGFQYKGDIKLDYPSTGKISFSMYEFDL